MTGRAHLVVAVALAAVLLFFLNLVRRGQLRGKYAMLWLAVGLGMVPLAVRPSLLTWVARKVGIFYEPTVLIFGLLGFLLIVCMHFSWELSRLEERTRTLAEELALLRGELESGASTKDLRDLPAELAADGSDRQTSDVAPNDDESVGDKRRKPSDGSL